MVTVYVYDDAKWSETLRARRSHVAVRADRRGVRAGPRGDASRRRSALRNAAGNFYINDKPTGAVVGQQPFGGARASGTNDKAGSKLNLMRWVSARTIKETFAPPTDYHVSVHGRGVGSGAGDCLMASDSRRLSVETLDVACHCHYRSRKQTMHLQFGTQSQLAEQPRSAS